MAVASVVVVVFVVSTLAVAVVLVSVVAVVSTLAVVVSGLVEVATMSVLVAVVDVDVETSVEEAFAVVEVVVVSVTFVVDATGAFMTELENFCISSPLRHA